jgi:uncharacterized protein (UPF0332 family)
MNIPKELSHSFHSAFESRQINDYGEIFTLRGEEAKQTLEEDHIFVSSIESYDQGRLKSGDSQ